MDFLTLDDDGVNGKTKTRPDFRAGFLNAVAPNLSSRRGLSLLAEEGGNIEVFAIHDGGIGGGKPSLGLQWFQLENFFLGLLFFRGPL